MHLLKRLNTDSSTLSPFSKDLKTLEETTFSSLNLAVVLIRVRGTQKGFLSKFHSDFRNNVLRDVSGLSAAWSVNSQNQSRHRWNWPFAQICSVLKYVLSPSNQQTDKWNQSDERQLSVSQTEAWIICIKNHPYLFFLFIPTFENLKMPNASF